MEFVVGQRWVSQAEPQLGLGLIIETDGRHITAAFPAVEEERMYAASNAPLARLVYQIGETLTDIDGNTLTVVAIEKVNQLNYYLTADSEGQEHIVPEAKISSIIELSSPSQRLFSGQFDKNSAFELRAATIGWRHQLQSSEVRGMLGPRTNLLRHQIYIAHEIASRFAPRVLLADEVGLGKTIEAGMILHHQLQTGLASRALIVVPEPLLHQWLVEMLRKFNLHFSLFDLQRYQSLEEAGEENPFESAQLILCSVDLLCDDQKIAQKATAAEWDILIVDEAHHLQWSENSVSREYQVVESLATKSDGLLLLTATPEQVGIDSHFARLRLLDSARFHDLNHFIEEQQKFVGLNSLVSSLNNQQPLSDQESVILQSYLSGVSDYDGTDSEINKTIIKKLLDHHGTGRVLFRNTRAAIQGFPARIQQGYPLIKSNQLNKYIGLYPEQALQAENLDWLATDPRVGWLEQQLTALKGEKVLLICSSAGTAIDLEKYLHLSSGIRSSAFYEGLSIIERDRAAAYFADEELGAQVLICSEIGSEGRNFQFAHHLILFDLPANPDLLEQRIGRLDRIGQTEDIKIHIPYIIGSAQEYLYRWYQEGLNVFTESFSAGLTVLEHFKQDLMPWLNGTSTQTAADFESLLKATAEYTEQLRKELQLGRDQLLELNSCDNDTADQLIEKINGAEHSDLLHTYMIQLFDTFGVEHDFHSEHCLVLHPSDHMLSDYFPCLKEEGVTINFSREKSQLREEMEFITWEHPMVTESMEMVFSMDVGKTAIAALQLKSIPAGTIIVECFFAIQCSAPKKLQINRFLPPTPIRVLLDSRGKDLSKVVTHEQLNKLAQHMKKSNRLAVLKQIRSELEKMIDIAQSQATSLSQPLMTEAEQQVNITIGGELDRLTELRKLNGTIRDEEIHFMENRKTEALKHIANASAELQAIRVLINL
ncbi:MAG: RNA polymerase-associated protein RapA [Pseudomonadota bacterium]|nr:RNA polymerase-associated protein RapA [Pseudomonadota bacterium]